MDMMNALTIVSLLTGVASLTLAAVAIWFATSAKKETNDLFARTQAMMNEQHEKTKDVLSQVDKRAAVIETTVSESQRELLKTMIHIVKGTVLPGREVGDDVKEDLLQMVKDDPEGLTNLFDRIGPLIEKIQQFSGSEEQ